jgi:hypothetical protein
VQFVKDRHIHIPHQLDGKYAQSSLVQALLEADEDRTFTRFSELPPEIRLMVYEHYMCELGNDHDGRRMLSSPSHPPLARLNRTLRQEVLPLFYETFMFYMLFSNANTHPEFMPRSKEFLSSIPVRLIGKITQLHVCIDGIDHPKTVCHVTIDMRALSKLLKINFIDLGYGFTREKNFAMSERLEKNVQAEIIDKIEYREGRKLQLEDIYAILRVVEKWKKAVS